MIRSLWIEVRRSPVRWWLPVLVGIDLAVLLLRPRIWVGVWPQAAAAAQLPAFYFGLALAAGAAWCAGRIARAEADELLLQMPRPAWQREAVALAAVWIYGIAAYLVGIAVAAVLSMRQAGPGFLWPSYLLLGLSMITLAVGVGHLAGRLFRSRFVAPLVALPILFLNVAVRFGQDHVFYVLSGAVQVGVSGRAVAIRLLVAFAVVALAVTAIPLAELTDARRNPRRLLPPVAAAAMLVAALVVLAGGGDLRYIRPAPARPLCSSGVPQVCVWPEDRKYLPVAAVMAQRLATLPDDLVRVPGTFYEQGLRATAESGNDFSTIFDTWSIAQSMAFSVSAATISTAECTVADADQQRYVTAAFELAQWLTERAYGGPQPGYIHGGPPGIDESAIHSVAAGSDAQQAEWARQRIDLMRKLCG